MWTDLSEWICSVKISVFHVNAHQRVIPAEGYFNNQEDMTMCFVNVSEPASLVTPVTYHWCKGKKGHGGKKGDYVWAQQHELLTKANLATAIADVQTAFQITFPLGSASAKTTICGVIEHLIHHDGIHTALLMTKAISSQPTKSSNGLMLTEFPDITMFIIALKRLIW